MPDAQLLSARWRFGVFEVDPASGELRKQGRKVRITEQSFQILLALIEHPGEIVTRQRLQERLWQDDTIVDFDANLNTAMSLLREALGDSAKNPRFIETLPRRGYRFLADVTTGAASTPAPPPPFISRRVSATLAALAVLMLAGVSYFYVAAPAPRIDSIAVLPLTYVGPQEDPDQEYLADGLTSALITELARLDVPNVISETSVMQYKAAGKPLPQIARELGADVLVEGSVLREGNTVRVNAQLIDARSDKHIWAGSYQEEIHSILTLQDEIAKAIARELRPALVPLARVAPTKAKAVNPHAYEAYLRGRYALRSEIDERRSKARHFFDEAIRLDPAFARAHEGLAEYYRFTDALPPAEALPEARRHALRALELDETLAGAHLSLAFVRLWGDWDWAGAEREFQRSLNLDPSDATIRRWYALFLDLTGQPQAASEQLRRVRALDPVSPHTYHALGFHFFLARRYDDALEQVRKLQELSPHDPKAFEGLGSLYVHTGAYAQAIAATEQGIALWGRDAAFVASLAVAHARAGNHANAKRLLQELHEAAGQRHVPPCWFAMIYMDLGDNDRAIEWLEKAFETRDAYLLHLKVSPQFDRVREDSRYQDLIGRMNFPRQQEDP